MDIQLIVTDVFIAWTLFLVTAFIINPKLAHSLGLKKVSKDGVEWHDPAFQVASQQQQQTPDSPEPPLSLEPGPTSPPDSIEPRFIAPLPQTVSDVNSTPVLKIVEQQIRPSLTAFDDAEKVKRLEQALASLFLHTTFMKIYMNIFGSQVHLLNVLNTGPITIESAKPFYQLAADREPAFYNGYTFENWLEFLTEHSLCEVDGEMVGATDHTMQFLLFITTNQLPYKPH